MLILSRDTDFHVLLKMKNFLSKTNIRPLKSITHLPTTLFTFSMTSSIYSGGFLCTLIVIFCSIAIQMRDQSPLNEYTSKNISSTKPYDSFEQFYIHYLDEHKLRITRLWHYLGTSLSLVYLLFNPKLSMAMFAGGLASYAIIPYTRHLSSGIVEMIVFLTIYLINGKLLTNSLKRTVLPLLLGYSCSWIGHFAFERNKPAAFSNPTYSFFGDIQMMYDAIKEQF